jgi:hypothetical protein
LLLFDSQKLEMKRSFQRMGVRMATFAESLPWRRTSQVGLMTPFSRTYLKVNPLLTVKWR